MVISKFGIFPPTLWLSNFRDINLQSLAWNLIIMVPLLSVALMILLLSFGIWFPKQVWSSSRVTKTQSLLFITMMKIISSLHPRTVFWKSGTWESINVSRHILHTMVNPGLWSLLNTMVKRSSSSLRDWTVNVKSGTWTWIWMMVQNSKSLELSKSKVNTEQWMSSLKTSTNFSFWPMQTRLLKFSDWDPHKKFKRLSQREQRDCRRRVWLKKKSMNQLKMQRWRCWSVHSPQFSPIPRWTTSVSLVLPRRMSIFLSTTPTILSTIGTSSFLKISRSITTSMTRSLRWSIQLKGQVTEMIFVPLISTTTILFFIQVPTTRSRFGIWKLWTVSDPLKRWVTFSAVSSSLVALYLSLGWRMVT